MRALSLGILAIALAAVATPAWSLELPMGSGRPPIDLAPAEAVRFGSTNREVAAIYSGSVAGTYTYDQGSGRWTDGQGNELTETRPASLLRGESGWGLVWLEHAAPALPTPVPTFTLAGSEVWSKPQSGGTAILGVFWGLVDNTVLYDPTANGGAGGYAVWGSGMEYEIYAVDLTAAEGSPEGLIYGNPADPVEPGDRTAANQVTGWPTTRAGAALLLKGTSAYFQYNGINTSKTTLYLNAESGLWAGELDSDFFPTPGGGNADVYMDWTIGQPDALGWVQSDDEASALPEPTTLCLLAGGALVALIRRRRS